MHGGRTFIWPYFLSLCGVPEGFITDRILLNVSEQAVSLFTSSFIWLFKRKMSYYVKFMLQKPVVFTSSYITEANQLGANHLHSQWVLGVFLPEVKADEAWT